MILKQSEYCVVSEKVTKMKMEKFSVSVFLIFFAIVPSFQQKLPQLVDNCGIKFDDITKTISLSDSGSNFAPWVVSIGFGENVEEAYELLCTGTIIKGLKLKFI